MTVPRQIVPGATYLFTRRCAQRQFLLRSSELTDAVFAYVLAASAKRYGILLHAFCVLSNHIHMVLTDPEGRVPEFAQHFCSLVARALNTVHGRAESFWAPGSYSLVRLVDLEDVVSKTAYTLANPAAADLVDRSADWPGLVSSPSAIGAGPRTLTRPTVFFKKKGPMPLEAELELVPPPGVSAESFRRAVETATAEREEVARAVREEARKSVLGAARVLAQRTTDVPRSPDRKREIDPRVAAIDKWKRIEALGRRKAFLFDYRAALLRLRGGERDVVFPHGTYLLRVSLKVRCAAAA